MPDSILSLLSAPLRICTACKLAKEYSSFRAEKRTKIGLQSQCKACESDYYKTPEVRARAKISCEKTSRTPERLAYKKEYAKRADVKQKNNVRTIVWQKANPTRVKANNDAWRASNSERKRDINADWNARNRPIANAQLAKYRANKARATPAWANFTAIKEFYISAAACGMHVDHVIPLHGKNVCGLHVHNNLQLLSKSENSSKGNRWSDE